MKVRKGIIIVGSFILSSYLATFLFILGFNLILGLRPIYSLETYKFDLIILNVEFYTDMLQILFFNLLAFLAFYYFLKRKRFIYYALIYPIVSTILYIIYFTLAISSIGMGNSPSFGISAKAALVFFIVSFAFYFFYHFLKKFFTKLL